jgi:uncharacterized protein YkwD
MKKPLRSGGSHDNYPGRYGRRASTKFSKNLIVIAISIIIVLVVVAVIFVSRLLSVDSASTIKTDVPIATDFSQETLARPLATASNIPDIPAFSTPFPIDVPYLQQYMFSLINQDRQSKGLSILRWDDIASTAGLNHAREMTTFQYMSHWNLDGYGPDYRYTQARGVNISRENVYSYVHSPGGGPKSAQDWETIIQSAQKAFMESPGHRENILDAAHTHVGIGIAYDPIAGRLSIAQEFVDRYLIIQPMPVTAMLNQNVEVDGKLAEGLSNPVINLAYESLPASKSVDELNQTSTYSSPAQIYQVVPLNVDANGNFSSTISINNQNQPGLYHIYIGADDQYGMGRLILDFVIKVSIP